MSRCESVELTNMCMITDEEGNVLVQNRRNPNWPGLVFPGGHVERGESFVDSVIREIREETGLTLLNPMLCGVKQFWKDDGTRYIVFLFRANQYRGVLKNSDEGEVFWMPREQITSERMAQPYCFCECMRVFEDPCLSEVYHPCENGVNDYNRVIFR